MHAPVQSVSATTPLAGLLEHGAWSTLDALPVIDGRGAFLGVIRHKSLRAKPEMSVRVPEPATALSALLDLGEVYWTGLFSAIETVATAGSTDAKGDDR